MREISANIIADTVAKLCIKANKELSCDLVKRIEDCGKCEASPLAKAVMKDIKDNISAAKKLDIPICQDTGMAVIFIEIGQEVHIKDGAFEDAVNDGVSKVSQQQFEHGYRTMLDLVETNFPSCQVFVCTLPYETYTDGAYRAGYNSTIENLAEEYNLPVIDLSNIWDETTEIKNNWHYLYDNIHPGVLGMQKISQQAIKSIKEFYDIE